jgi:uncharacterized protein
MRHLTLTSQQVVSALVAVASAQFETPGTIRVYPIANYLDAAVKHLMGLRDKVYEPDLHEWALVIDTSGDTYNHSECYSANGLMGNIFRDSMATILSSRGRDHSLALRRDRAKTCEKCLFDGSCSRLPIVEALPSERTYDEQGKLRCEVAQPVIEYLINRIRSSHAARTLIETTSVKFATAAL